jgi:hypothetical protein
MKRLRSQAWGFGNTSMIPLRFAVEGLTILAA